MSTLTTLARRESGPAGGTRLANGDGGSAANGNAAALSVLADRGWLPGYRRSWFRTDLIAGLTIVALLIPEGMAYAQLAGVPPEAAFYAAPIGLVMYAIFGSSRHLVVAVSSAVATMSFAAVSLLAQPNTSEFIVLTAAMAVVAGELSRPCRVVEVWSGGAVLLRLGDGGVHHRARSAHHGEAAAEDMRRRRRRRQRLGAPLRLRAEAAGNASPHADDRRDLPDPHGRSGALPPEDPSSARGVDRRHRPLGHTRA